MEKDEGVEKDSREEMWHGKMGKSFDGLYEEDGRIYSVRVEREKDQTRSVGKETHTHDNVKRLLIRNVVLLLDMSNAMKDNDVANDLNKHDPGAKQAHEYDLEASKEDDITPILHRNEKGFMVSRMDIVLNCTRMFVEEFFRQNPLSRIAIIGLIDRRPLLRCDFTSSLSHALSALKDIPGMDGSISLESGLFIAKTLFESMVMEGSKEVICILGSISTNDKDLFSLVDKIRDTVKVTVVSLSGEIRAFKYITEKTEGSYHVVSKASDLKTRLYDFCLPPPLSSNAKKSVQVLVPRIGFPKAQSTSQLSLCVCHEAYRYGGYRCVDCQSKYCELPVKCRICGMFLTTSTEIARSYRHIYHVPAFPSVDRSALDPQIITTEESRCFSCNTTFESQTVEMCSKCKNIFCRRCDDYIHKSLHNCPGCDE